VNPSSPDSALNGDRSYELQFLLWCRVASSLCSCVSGNGQ